MSKEELLRCKRAFIGSYFGHGLMGVGLRSQGFFPGKGREQMEGV